MSLHPDSSSTTPQHEHAEIARLGTATVCEADAAPRGAGVMVDGSVRDTAQLHEPGLPVWARGVAVPGTTKSGSVDTTEVVVVEEVQIKAGNIVVADADAVVIVDSGEVASVLEAGRQRDRHEAGLRAAIAARATTFDLLGLGS
jgi:4-hydroxy-4-methyl-2-oxoglutarate aldolase